MLCTVVLSWSAMAEVLSVLATQQVLVLFRLNVNRMTAASARSLFQLFNDKLYSKFQCH